VPVLFLYLMRGQGHAAAKPAARRSANPIERAHRVFEHYFERAREGYRNALAWALSEVRLTVIAFLGVIVISLPLFPFLGRDFFPDVDAGQMRLHVRAPAGTRIETTQQDFAQVESAI